MLVDIEKTVSRSQAARMLNKSAETVSLMIRLGKLEAIDTPLGRLILREDVERLMKSQGEKKAIAGR